MKNRDILKARVKGNTYVQDKTTLYVQDKTKFFDKYVYTFIIKGEETKLSRIRILYEILYIYRYY